MRIKKIYQCLTVALATVSLLFVSCEEGVSNVGNSLSPSESTIHVDTLILNLKAATVAAPDFESRSAYTMIGSIRVPEYGSLDCSFVSQFLPTENLDIPDSITPEKIDSVKLILSIPKTYVTGDTLAPQQLKVFSLTKPLPADITPSFNPEGYYDSSSPMATKSYTLSGFRYSDSTYTASSNITVKTLLPVELGRNVVKAYRENPDIFIWPEIFAQKYWPGVYVEPSFGKGCIAPIRNTSIFAYYPKGTSKVIKDEEGNYQSVNVVVADSVCLFSTAPEVLSNVNIQYLPSRNIEDMIADGKSIVTTPGGYTVSFTFPAKEILDTYWQQESDLGVINNMIFSIPAKLVKNDYGIGLAPALLMVKTSEMDSFFAEGRLPDNKSSFTSVFSDTDNSYSFNSMRKYIVDLVEKGADNIQPEDVEFTLVPVTVTTEDYTDPSTGSAVTVVTTLTPYIIMPTMAELETEKAKVVFTFSNQLLY